MWPNGLGLMLFNGRSGLIYYSNKAARVFVSNAGFVATIAIGGYRFPEQTVAGVFGAAAIRGATWLTKKVEDEYQVSIGRGIKRLLAEMPNFVSVGYEFASETLGSPMSIVYRKVYSEIALNPRLSWVNESLFTQLFTQLLAPLLEESIFRVGVQEGLAQGLMAVDVPRPVANFLSGVISASLFARAHNPDLTHAQYRDTLVSGIGFGVMMYVHGLPAAVVAHSANNAAVRLEGLLRR
jgi:membrane protease YdiL (CAAX protease family)